MVRLCCRPDPDIPGRLFMRGNGRRSAVIRPDDRCRTNLGYYTTPGAMDVELRDSYSPDTEGDHEDTMEDALQTDQPIDTIPEQRKPRLSAPSALQAAILSFEADSLNADVNEYGKLHFSISSVSTQFLSGNQCMHVRVFGNETEIIISRYEDHFLVSADEVVFYVFMVIVLTFLTAYQVIATQIGTMGTIVYARNAFLESGLVSHYSSPNGSQFELQFLLHLSYVEDLTSKPRLSKPDQSLNW
ncbi:hypothetical protein V8G54_007682 [Vigna mungo]|uniref:Uncharacterized protein n=1 Tax=Vigna mungo TaxID=3915 RepID=A0AAQ3P2C9_VIGMU